MCAVLGLMWGIAACRSKPEAAPRGELAAPQPQLPSQPPPAPEPLPAIPQAALQELLDSWLAAQNQGRFEAYQALYAAKFYGWRRAGAREVRFDRDGWLTDRKRMFQKPMMVEAREPKFQASSASAQLEFTQHWASGNFEDLGAKRMLVVREAGQLRIAQEELLRSEVIAAAATPAVRAELDFYFTLKLDSGLYLSLPAAPVPVKLGPLHNEDGELDSDMYTVSRDVQAADLDPGLASWQGRKVRLDDGCVAQVAGFRALTRVVPHFGERQRWNGISFGDEEQVKPLSPAQVAREAYKLGTPALFAKLTGCSDGRYARLERSPPPLAAVGIEDSGLEARALAAFSKLPSVLEQQKQYLEETPGAQDNWWDGNSQVAVYKHPTSGQVLVSVLAAIRDGCSDFSASEWVLFERQGKALKRLTPAQTPPQTIDAVLDVDGDGRLEFLVTPDRGTDIELVWPASEVQGPALRYVYLDCPC